MITKIGKIIQMIFWVLLLLSTNSLSQEEANSKSVTQSKGISFQFGYLSLRGIPSDIFLSTSYISPIDKYVDISLGFDFYRKKYTNNVPVATEYYPSGVQEVTTIKSIDYETIMIPGYLKLGLKLSLTEENRIFLFATGGFGYAGLLNQEKNYAQNIYVRRFYHGFFNTFSGGVIFKLGDRSALIADLLYNQCSVTRKKQGSPAWLPVNDVVNLTGMGFRIGLRIGKM